MGVTYRKAGVDIAAADRWLHQLRGVIRATHGPEVLPDRGQFAGLYALGRGRYHDPILVSSTDGVGTKLKLAQLIGRHEGIGVDAVAMNTNDILVYGAAPLFFLDYIAMGRIDGGLLSALVRGIADGCRQSGCALIGGETAEMPGAYGVGEYDVAGFCVGVVERRQLLDGASVHRGDLVVGLASSGVHANGFSLVRAVFAPRELKRLGRELLTPTRIYVKPVLRILRRFRLHALAHVTGGGLRRRLASLTARQPALDVAWRRGSWPVPEMFRRIQAAGQVSDEQMESTFNMGIGMALACAPRDGAGVIRLLRQAGVAAWPIGTVERR